MATLDWSECSAVESIPGKVSGAWVLRGTRTPVQLLFENLEAGMSIEEVIEQYPVSREEINSLMAFVARSLSKRPRATVRHRPDADSSRQRHAARSCPLPCRPFRGRSASVRVGEEFSNGELIDIAEQTGFEVIVTTDKNIRYQQELKGSQNRVGSARTHSGPW